jgi:hypothetical protein
MSLIIAAACCFRCCCSWVVACEIGLELCKVRRVLFGGVVVVRAVISLRVFDKVDYGDSCKLYRKDE